MGDFQNPKIKPVAFVIITGFLTLCMSCSSVSRLYDQALAHINEGDYDGAIKNYRDILSITENNTFYLNNLGWTLFRNDDLTEAIRILEKAQSLCDDQLLAKNISVNLFMATSFRDGQKLLEQKNYASAENKFAEVISKYDVGEMGIKYTALCYGGEGRKSEEISEWRKILDRYKTSKIRNRFYVLAEEMLSK